jgi:hypothetical protein
VDEGLRPVPLRPLDPPPKPAIASHLSDAEWRRRAANVLYELETAFREEGWGDPALLYDEEGDLYRYRDGRFAFSREWADWSVLWERKHPRFAEGR